MLFLSVSYLGSKKREDLACKRRGGNARLGEGCNQLQKKSKLDNYNYTVCLKGSKLK